MRRLAWIVGVVSVSGCGRGVESGDAFRPLDVGSPVPTYVARALDGQELQVGGPEAPTVLNVWATWCTSCREEMAALDSLQREFGSQGVRVIAVSVDESDDKRVRRFADANHLTMVVAHDPTNRVGQVYRLMGVPSTLLIGRDGRLVWQCTGSILDRFSEVRQAVRTASAQPPSQ